MMGKGKLRRILISTLALGMGFVLIAGSACTPSEAKLIEGILQDVDIVNGEVTIVTKDGKTVTLTIATEAPVETEEASSTLEALEPGVFVEVEVNDDGQVAQHINARLAKVEGVIVGIEGDNVIVESERGRMVTVLVTDRTRIKLEEDFPGTLADLQVGAEVGIKFDPESRVAFKIDTEEEEAEIEGVIVQIDGDEVTIETERGHRRTLVITNITRIELDEHFPGTLADLEVGVEVEAKFDPFTRVAFKIEVEEEEAESPELAQVSTVGWGIIEIRVTDPPPADVISAIVYLTNIEVHKVSANESGWIPIIGAPPSFDLMVVSEVTAILGSANITAGKFTQIRMDVDRVEVVTSDGDNIIAEVPGGKLKIVRPFSVGGGVKTVLTLDFNGEKSLILRGKDGAAGKKGALFKPVVKLLVDKEKVDKKGDNGKPSISPGVGGDTTPPVIDVTGVADGQEIVSPDAVTPEFTVSDDTDPNPTVTATLNGEPFTSGTEVSEPGEYDLEVTAVDASGNEAEMEVNFTIIEVGDTTPPEIDVTGVTDGQQSSGPVIPVISVSDDTDPNPTVTVTLNGESFTSGAEVSEPGEYALEVTAVDASGNETEVEIHFTIVPE